MSIIPPIRMTPDEDERLLEELLRSTSPPDSGSSGPFSIEDRADRYVIRGLAKPYHDGSTFTLELSKQLLDSGNAHTQDGWQDAPSLRTIGGTVWELPSGPEYGSLILGLYAHKDHPVAKPKVEAVKTLLKGDFDPYWMMTSTRITYKAGQPVSGLRGLIGRTPPASAQDIITHHYKRSNEPKVNTALAGKNDWFAAGLEEQMYVLLGSRNVDTFIAATEWLTEKKPYLWRINTPSQDESRALVLGVGNYGGFSVGAGDRISDSRHARGVAVRENFP